MKKFTADVKSQNFTISYKDPEGKNVSEQISKLYVRISDDGTISVGFLSIEKDSKGMCQFNGYEVTTTEDSRFSFD
jgi:hypothetical protein